MQGWIVLGAWAFAVVFALVTLGFAGYELRWKAERLRRDQARLQALAAELASAGSAMSSAVTAVRATSTSSASRAS